MKAMMVKTSNLNSEEFFSKYSTTQRDRLFTHCFSVKNELLRQSSPHVYRGVTELIPRLSESFELFIVSGCGRDYPDIFLNHSNLANIFKKTVCWGDYLNSKDKNLGLIKQKFRLENTCYLGDTNSDRLACEKVNLPFIFASYGFGNCNYNGPRINNFLELTSTISYH